MTEISRSRLTSSQESLVGMLEALLDDDDVNDVNDNSTIDDDNDNDNVRMNSSINGTIANTASTTTNTNTNTTNTNTTTTTTTTTTSTINHNDGAEILSNWLIDQYNDIDTSMKLLKLTFDICKQTSANGYIHTSSLSLFQDIRKNINFIDGFQGNACFILI